MLRKLILGLVVIALLTGCAGMALPETLSEITLEEEVPLSDRQALAEFQLETSGDIGVGVEPAVPAPVEDVDLYWQEFLLDDLTYIDRSPGLAGKAVPAPVEEIAPETDGRLIKERLELEAMQTGGALPIIPTPTDDVWFDGDVIIGYGPTNFKMPTLEKFTLPTDGKWGPNYDTAFELMDTPPTSETPVKSAVPAPVEEIAPETDGRLIKERLELEAMQTVGAGLVHEVAPATVPDSLLETNPVYYEWLLENK